MPPNRRPIGYCQICFEEQPDAPVLAYYRRHYRDRRGKWQQGVMMCVRHSNLVSRYGDPYASKRPSAATKAEIVARYMAGDVTLRDLAAEYGYDHGTIARWVREARRKKKPPGA